MILDESGYEVQDQNGIADVFSHYFEELFTTSNSDTIQNVVNCCSSKLRSDHVNHLGAIYIVEELKVAVFDIEPDKAPGLDGVNVGFYRKNWDLLGSDIIKGVLDVVNNGTSVAIINQTNITLVPNKKCACSKKDL